MKTPEHIYQPACARCRDEAGKDRAGVVDTSLCNWHTNDLVLSLRAENERLKERLDRIDAFAGERCEASGCRPDPCGPVEYHDVEGVPLCAECWQECLDEAAEREERGKEKGK